MAWTAVEQLVIELINRARLDPAGEAAKYGISLNEGLAPGTISPASKQPLAPNDALLAAARGHSQFMIDNDVAGHEGIGDGTPTTRMNNKGYFGLLGENIGSSGSTGSITELSRAIDIFENLFIDTSVAGRGHRLNILRADYREAGIGEVVGLFTESGTDFNTVMQTTNFGARAGNVFITGVAINDIDNDNFYDVGQGHGGVKITVRFGGTVSSDTTEAAGGYAAAVAPGKPYTVSFSEGGLASPVSVSVVGVTQNVKIDLLGTSEILSSTSTVLGAGAKVLGLLGSAAINGVGNALANAITGNKATNSLNGAAGNDTLAGGGGADRLTGGVGKDAMSGGLANDIFDFNALGEMGKTAVTRDRIADFAHLADRIDLSTIDAVMGPGNQTFSFIGAGAFAAVKGQLHYRFEGPAKTIVEGDVDGNKLADFQIELTGHKVLQLSPARRRSLPRETVRKRQQRHARGALRPQAADGGRFHSLRPTTAE